SLVGFPRLGTVVGPGLSYSPTNIWSVGLCVCFNVARGFYATRGFFEVGGDGKHRECRHSAMGLGDRILRRGGSRANWPRTAPFSARPAALSPHPPGDGRADCRRCCGIEHSLAVSEEAPRQNCRTFCRMRVCNWVFDWFPSPLQFFVHIFHACSKLLPWTFNANDDCARRTTQCVAFGRKRAGLESTELGRGSRGDPRRGPGVLLEVVVRAL